MPRIMKRLFVMGLGIIFSLSLFTTSALANDQDYPFYKVTFFKSDKGYDYIDFFPIAGEFDRSQKQGFNLTVDYESVSYQSVLITVTADPGVMDERVPTKFYVILPSGEVVDEFYAMYYPEQGIQKTYYYRNATLTDDYIGALATLQVVAVSSRGSTDTEYVVGWTAPVGPIQFKPLPVIDREAISWLQAIHNKLDIANMWLELIYNKLQDLLEMLSAALAKLTKAVEDAYKPSEQAKQQLDQAIENLMEKVPMQEIGEQMQDVANKLEETRGKLKQPGQLVIGEEFYFIPPEMNYFTSRYGIDSSIKTHIIDLTQFKEEVKTMRLIMQAALWVLFFHMLFNLLTPKPRL